MKEIQFHEDREVSTDIVMPKNLSAVLHQLLSTVWCRRLLSHLQLVGEKKQLNSRGGEVLNKFKWPVVLVLLCVHV